MKNYSNYVKLNRDEIHELLLQDNRWVLEYCDEKYKDDFDLGLLAVGIYPYNLRHLSLRLRDNADLVKTALIIDGTALQFASEKIKSNWYMVYRAVKQNGTALGYASDNLRGNLELVMHAIRSNPYAFRYAMAPAIKSKEVVLCAVKALGENLEFVGGALVDDKEVVLEAVQVNGLALQYASKRLREDVDVVLTAFAQNKEAADWSLIPLSAALVYAHKNKSVSTPLQEGKILGEKLKNILPKNIVICAQHLDINGLVAGIYNVLATSNNINLFCYWNARDESRIVFKTQELRNIENIEALVYVTGDAWDIDIMFLNIHDARETIPTGFKIPLYIVSPALNVPNLGAILGHSAMSMPSLPEFVYGNTEELVNNQHRTEDEFPEMVKEHMVAITKECSPVYTKSPSICNND